jgi:hypothetical protein
MFNAEFLNSIPSHGRAPGAGVRVMQPSTGGDDSHYAPPSDVYLYLSVADAQKLSAYFSAIARKLQGVEA